MNPNETIFNFIDGALDSSQEQLLFDELARQPELRSELRHYIALGEAVRADREAYAPPADVEQRLMAGLGLAPIAPMASAGGGAGIAATAARRTGFSQYLPVVASFVLGLIVAGSSVYYAMSGDAPREMAQSARDTVFVMTAPAAAPGVESPSMAAAEQLAAAPRLNAPRAVSPRSFRAAPLFATQSDDAVSSRVSGGVEGDSLLDPTTIGAAVASVEPRLALQGPVLVSSNDEELGVRGRELDPISSLIGIDERTDGFVEARRTTLTQPFVANDANVVEERPYDEATIGVYLRTSERSAIGIEAGQGRYNQVLVIPEDYVDEHGNPIGESISRIDQSPNVMWFGLAARQQLGAPLPSLQTWIQGTLGYGVNNGPMLNARLGASYEMLPGVSATGAIETSTLIYMFNRQPLVSGKYGVTIGLQYGW